MPTQPYFKQQRAFAYARAQERWAVLKKKSGLPPLLYAKDVEALDKKHEKLLKKRKKSPSPPPKVKAFNKGKVGGRQPVWQPKAKKVKKIKPHESIKAHQASRAQWQAVGERAASLFRKWKQPPSPAANESAAVKKAWKTRRQRYGPSGTGKKGKRAKKK